MSDFSLIMDSKNCILVNKHHNIDSVNIKVDKGSVLRVVSLVMV